MPVLLHPNPLVKQLANRLSPHALKGARAGKSLVISELLALAGNSQNYEIHKTNRNLL